MTEPAPVEPQTEEDALAANARITRALRWSPLFYTPVVALLLWATNVPYWAGITAIFILIELCAYPVLKRSLDASTEKQIAAVREKNGEF